MALRQFLEYHFDGSEAKLKIFLEQPVEDEQPGETSDGDTEALSLGLREPLPD